MQLTEGLDQPTTVKEPLESTLWYCNRSLPCRKEALSLYSLARKEVKTIFYLQRTEDFFLPVVRNARFEV